MISFLFFSDKLLILIKNNDNKFLIKCRKYIESYNQATKKINKKEWYIQFTISLIVWLLFPIKMGILANSFGVDLGFFVVLAITMSAYMVGMFPLTPGGIGTFEGTMILMLGMLSIHQATAFTITVIFRFITFWFVILVSFIFVVVYKGIEQWKIKRN